MCRHNGQLTWNSKALYDLTAPDDPLELLLMGGCIRSNNTVEPKRTVCSLFCIVASAYTGPKAVSYLTTPSDALIS